LHSGNNAFFAHIQFTQIGPQVSHLVVSHGGRIAIKTFSISDICQGRGGSLKVNEMSKPSQTVSGGT